MSSDDFEATLAQELVKLQQRLIAEHRKSTAWHNQATNQEYGSRPEAPTPLAGWHHDEEAAAAENADGHKADVERLFEQLESLADHDSGPDQAVEATADDALKLGSAALADDGCESKDTGMWLISKDAKGVLEPMITTDVAVVTRRASQPGAEASMPQMVTPACVVQRPRWGRSGDLELPGVESQQTSQLRCRSGELELPGVESQQMRRGRSRQSGDLELMAVESQQIRRGRSSNVSVDLESPGFESQQLPRRRSKLSGDVELLGGESQMSLGRSKLSGDLELAGAESPLARGRRRALTPSPVSGTGNVTPRKTFSKNRSRTLSFEMRRTTASGGEMTPTPVTQRAFEPLPAWKRSVMADIRSRVSCLGTNCHLLRRTDTLATARSTAETHVDLNLITPPSPLRAIIVSPSFLPRLCWDFVAMFMIVYDCLMIPLMVFDTQFGFARVMVWITRLFWTINILVSAITGFMKKDGSMEMRPKKVVKNYLRTWFMPDMVVVGIDWSEVIVETGGGSWSRFGNVLRLLRITRVVRIVRFIKAPEMMDFFNEYIRSEEVLLIASLGKVILLTLSVAHIIACLWYGVGSLNTGDDRRWTKLSDVENMGFGLQYLHAFHWSLAQFTGNLIIEPQNETERAFTVVVLFLAIIGSAMFVSSLTTSMTRLQILSSKQSSQLAMLRRFLLDRNISRPLATRVQQNAQYAMQEQKKDIPEASVHLLDLISTPLLIELHFEIYSQMLVEHPFFNCYNHINPGGVQRVCHQAVRLFTMYQGDLLFSDYEVPASKRMYFIVHGGLDYAQPTRRVVAASKSSWLCEAFLWTHWSHCGSARANRTSRILELDTDKFQNIVSTFPSPHARHYAELFVDGLNQTELDDLTDLETLADELDDLIEMAFPVDEEEDEVEAVWSIAEESGFYEEDKEEKRSSQIVHTGLVSGSHRCSVSSARRLSSRAVSPRSRCSHEERSHFRTAKTSSRLSGRLSGSTARHSRSSSVARRLSKLSRQDMERSESTWFLCARFWGSTVKDYWCRCRCGALRCCTWFACTGFSRLWSWWTADEGDVQPFQGPVP